MCWDFDDDLGLSSPDAVPLRGRVGSFFLFLIDTGRSFQELVYLALIFWVSVLFLIVMYEVCVCAMDT